LHYSHVHKKLRGRVFNLLALSASSKELISKKSEFQFNSPKTQQAHTVNGISLLIYIIISIICLPLLFFLVVLIASSGPSAIISFIALMIVICSKGKRQ
jgi:hypothetical protein